MRGIALEFKLPLCKEAHFDTVITGLERCFTLEYKTLIKLKFFHEIMHCGMLCGPTAVPLWAELARETVTDS